MKQFLLITILIINQLTFSAEKPVNDEDPLKDKLDPRKAPSYLLDKACQAAFEDPKFQDNSDRILALAQHRCEAQVDTSMVESTMARLTDPSLTKEQIIEYNDKLMKKANALARRENACNALALYNVCLRKKQAAELDKTYKQLRKDFKNQPALQSKDSPCVIS